MNMTTAVRSASHVVPPMRSRTSPPSASFDAVSPLERRMLDALSEPAAVGKAAGDTIQISAEIRGVRISRGQFPRSLASGLVALGLVNWRGTKDGAELVVTAEASGRKPASSVTGKSSFATQAAAAEPPNEESSAPRINLRESPLAWLRRRQGEGERLIDDAAFQAGERFRADFEKAGLAPRLSIDWTKPPGAKLSAGLNPTEAMVTARQRFNTAVKAMGEDVGGVAIDVCCFLKGLETVERERGWPARSAKVVLSMGLASLAKHYGYQNEAVGAANRNGIRAWHADTPQ